MSDPLHSRQNAGFALADVSLAVFDSVTTLRDLQADLESVFSGIKVAHEDHRGTLLRQAYRVAHLVGNQGLEPGDARVVFLLATRHLVDAPCSCTCADATKAIDDAIALAIVDVVLKPITLISFGYLHLNDGQTPQADRVEDVRDRLRTPAAAQDILELDGRDPRVQTVILNTAGARELLENLANYSRLPAGPSRIAIGCADGRHCAAALAELLAFDLQARGRVVKIEHRHMHLQRVLRAGEAR